MPASKRHLKRRVKQKKINKKVKIETFKQCRDFELAPLVKLPKNLFLYDENEELNKFKAFILTLSTIFNELKNISWFAQQLDNGKPPKNELSAYCGQWSGMQWYVTKVISCLLCEFMELLKRNRDVTSSKLLNDIVDKMPENLGKESWKKLISFDAARVPGSKDKFIKFLCLIVKIRDNIGYHYYNTENFYEGYLAWLSSQEGKNMDSLYSSFGPSLETTRFYFGDITNVGYMKKFKSQFQVDEKDIRKNLEILNQALRFVIENSINYLEKNLGIKDPT